MKKSNFYSLLKLLILVMLCSVFASAIACKVEEHKKDDDSSSSYTSSINSGESSPGSDVTTAEKGVVSVVVGKVRVQLLSETLVRIEDEYENGFEDRASYIVQNRQNWYKIDYTVEDGILFYSAYFVLLLLILTGITA